MCSTFLIHVHIDMNTYRLIGRKPQVSFPLKFPNLLCPIQIVSNHFTHPTFIIFISIFSPTTTFTHLESLSKDRSSFISRFIFFLRGCTKIIYQGTDNTIRRLVLKLQNRVFNVAKGTHLWHLWVCTMQEQPPYFSKAPTYGLANSSTLSCLQSFTCALPPSCYKSFFSLHSLDLFLNRFPFSV